MNTKKTTARKILSIVQAVLVSALIVVLGLFVFVPIKETSASYAEYFLSLKSADGYSQAQSVLNLGEGISIARYDTKSGVFVTLKKIVNIYSTGESDRYINLYGFASESAILCQPKYTNVVEIKGDYAIVTKSFVQFNEEDNKNEVVDHVGVVKFRGGEEGDRTDFSSANTEYNYSYDQFAFLGEDYIVCPGIKEFPSHIYNFSTVYNYKKYDRLLEVGKLRNIDYSCQIALYDDYMVAIGDSTGYAYFYNIKQIDGDGYFTLTDYDTYKGIPQDVNNEYGEYITIYMNYLGNGWFTRTAVLATTEVFEGYNIIFQEYDSGTGSQTTKYARIRSDLYNARTKTSKGYDWLYINTVINRYDADSYTSIVDSLNNKAIADTEYTDRYEYHLPYLNPAYFIKKGYSLLYFYYFPYDSSPFTYEISFCIMDENAELVRLEEVIMPPLFIDGVGVQSSDPTFETVYGNAKYINMDGEFTLLSEAKSNVSTFATIMNHNGAVIAQEISVKNKTSLYGAFDVGGRQITPFVYRELSIFMGGYAMGTKVEDGKLKTYRVDKEGKETEVSDQVVNIRQGVYVYASGGLVGIKNYAGDSLLPAEYKTADVFEIFSYGDKLLTSYAVAYKDNSCYLFKLV